MSCKVGVIFCHLGLVLCILLPLCPMSFNVGVISAILVLSSASPKCAVAPPVSCHVGVIIHLGLVLLCAAPPCDLLPSWSCPLRPRCPAKPV
uniref:Putative secreted protein n=1 Tax=Xenopsylla cheopis TaxID=163159 RepID=A0A6M2DZH4_XENCH